MSDVIEKINIRDMIYNIRGNQIIFDFDLAKLYKCKNGTKTINQAVKRHLDRFPKRFMFQLNFDEYDNLKSQIGTAKLNMNRSLPYAFTEEGVAMLATILRTDIATKVSILIMDAFVNMRKMLAKDSELYKQLYYFENKIIAHDYDIKLLKETFEKLEEKQLKNEIYFNGQIYDSYSKIIDMLSEAKEEIIIIDTYADKKVLDIIKNINKKVIIITKENNLLKNIDINKYKKQYNNLNVYYDNTFHDRFIIIDRKIFYHLGSSLNHLGEKTFAINIILEDSFKEDLLTRVNSIFL